MIRSAKDFGILITLGRKKLGWTQTELAARLDDVLIIAVASHGARSPYQQQLRSP
jgi:ribosome-binding protein aMBF1 (putative translation factor)